MDGGDVLHVQGGGSWSAFSPEHEFLQRVPAERTFDQGMGVVLDDGRILSSGADIIEGVLEKK